MHFATGFYGVYFFSVITFGYYEDYIGRTVAPT